MATRDMTKMLAAQSHTYRDILSYNTFDEYHTDYLSNQLQATIYEGFSSYP